jgi:hypothetical protein
METNLAAVFDFFRQPSPAQQLADRFLAGYPWKGEFLSPRAPLKTVFVSSAEREPELGLRLERFGIKLAGTVEGAVGSASAVLVALEKPWLPSAGERVLEVLRAASAGARVFVWGVPGAGLAQAQAALEIARSRKLALSSGTFFPCTWRLPALEVPLGLPLREALVVAVGEREAGFLGGLDALLSLVERRRGGEAGVRSVRRLAGAEAWKLAGDESGMRELLAAAVSRSDTPLGDPERDARTQDIVGLGLLPRLVAEPEALVLEHADGLRSAVFLLSGALRDFNFALLGAAGDVLSAQLYRPPPPSEHHYSLLARAVEEFFVTGAAPHPIERNLLAAGALEALAGSPPPALAIPYQPPGESEFAPSRG